MVLIDSRGWQRDAPELQPRRRCRRGSYSSASDVVGAPIHPASCTLSCIRQLIIGPRGTAAVNQILCESSTLSVVSGLMQLTQLTQLMQLMHQSSPRASWPSTHSAAHARPPHIMYSWLQQRDICSHWLITLSETYAIAEARVRCNVGLGPNFH